MSIPSSIEKLRLVCPLTLLALPLENHSLLMFRYLRTLLLEGNQLTDLPPQLGRLRHLTGLNIANNPLITPPRYIVEKGTKVGCVAAVTIGCLVTDDFSTRITQAVLKYLLECLNEVEEPPDSRPGDATVTPHSLSQRTVPIHPINDRYSLVASM